MTKFVVNDREVGQRLDKVIALRFPEQSRAYWQKLIDSKTVQVNQLPGSVDYHVKIDDQVEIELPEQADPVERKQISVEIPIIFENEDVLVINKPAGVVTHPAHGQHDTSIAEWAGDYNAGIRSAVYDETNPISHLRAGIVHRLDKDTSGVMIIAKTTASMTFLAKQIQNHSVTKVYHALLFGHLEQSPQTVEGTLNRSSADRRKMAFVEPEKGRESKTIFTIINQMVTNKNDKATYVEARPITGRTHQIRVHAAHIGHPILGDAVYGSHESTLLSERLGIKRQWLHAHSLTIRIPNEAESRMFVAELPYDLKTYLKIWHNR